MYGFSMKQYYSRMQRLLAYGLVKRKLGTYSLSSFGRLVYQIKLRMDAAIKEYHSLKAVDFVKEPMDLPEEVRKKISNIVIDDDIKIAMLGETTSPELTLRA